MPPTITGPGWRPPCSPTLPCWGTMSVGAELTAVSTTLDELTRRVGRILSGLSPSEDERYGTDLAEIERALGVANRRLERLATKRA